MSTIAGLLRPASARAANRPGRRACAASSVVRRSARVQRAADTAAVIASPEARAFADHLVEQLGHMRLVRETALEGYFGKPSVAHEHRFLGKLEAMPDNVTVRRLVERSPKCAREIARA